MDEVAYITVGVGGLRITNTSDGNGNDKRLVRCERSSNDDDDDGDDEKG